MDDYQALGAAELGRRIGSGALDPVALTDSFLDAIRAHPDGARIYARTTPQRARAEAAAAAARARGGFRRGPLDGVPISWKDLFDTAGTATESGTRLLAGRVPARDALVLQRATLQGLVCLGKTHQTELAFSGLGLNPMTATPPNVNDAALVPGGSSSGAATSVAFGLAAAGIGSDTGGSVRVPAAWNDLVGLKTTHGVLPLDGVVPLCPRFDTVGPLTRTVEDAALLFSAMGGAASDLSGASLSGLRLMVLEDVAMEDIRDQPARAFTDAAERLAAAGARVTRQSVPWLRQMLSLAATLYAPEAYGVWGAAIEEAPEKMYAPVRDRFRGGAEVPAHEYVAGWERLYAQRARWADETAGFDAVILPTTPNLPPDAARLQQDEDYFRVENLLTLRNTRIGNMLDLCALTLPTGTPSCGLTLMAAPGAEARLLRIGRAAEAALS